VLVEGCVSCSYTPFVGSTDDPNAPAAPSTTVPTLQRVDGIQLYWPVDVPTMTVTLRGPELDNKDRLRFQRINRETRGRTLVVFADPIWPKVQQLTLEFIGLEEDEAQSLLSFITATLGKEVGLRDWEILKNTYTYDPQSMSCRNHKFACAANFVGSGDCDDVNDCLALLVSAGKKFNVTVEYHTVRAYYPGSPV